MRALAYAAITSRPLPLLVQSLHITSLAPSQGTTNTSFVSYKFLKRILPRAGDELSRQGLTYTRKAPPLSYSPRLHKAAVTRLRRLSSRGQEDSTRLLQHVSSAVLLADSALSLLTLILKQRKTDS